MIVHPGDYFSFRSVDHCIGKNENTCCIAHCFLCVNEKVWHNWPVIQLLVVAGCHRRDAASDLYRLKNNKLHGRWTRRITGYLVSDRFDLRAHLPNLLGKILSTRCSTIFTCNGKRPVLFLCDFTLSTTASLGHSFTDLFKSFLDVWLRRLQNESYILQLRTSMLITSGKNCLPDERNILNLGNGSHDELVSMGMTSSFFLLFCTLN